MVDGMVVREPLPAGALTGEQAVKTLIGLGRRLYDRGWMPATSGNLSIRVGEAVVSTGSGCDKGAMGPEDLLWTDREGRAQVQGETPPGRPKRGPSAELALHLMLYRLLPQTGCVLHVHSPMATLCSRGAASPLLFTGWELQKGLEGVSSHEQTVRLPLVQNDQDMGRLCSAVERVLSPMSWAWLIAGHGIYAWGRDPASAFRHLETWDFLLNLYFLEQKR